MKLSAHNLSYYYKAGTNVIKNKSFELRAGEVLGFIGYNGSGKSTLLKISCGYLQPRKGEQSLQIEGKELPRNEWHNHIGFAAPYVSLYDELTIKEHIELLSKAQSQKLDEKKFQFLLNAFSLNNKENEFIKSLSTGMRQKTRLIIAFYFEKKILAFDEPTATLDDRGAESFFNLCKEYAQKGVGIIIATNDEKEKSLCNKFVDCNK